MRNSRKPTHLPVHCVHGRRERSTLQFEQPVRNPSSTTHKFLLGSHQRPPSFCHLGTSLFSPISSHCRAIQLLQFHQNPAHLSKGSSAKIMGFSYHWTSGQKNHISPKRAKTSIAIYRTTYPSLSLACRRVPLLLLLHLLFFNIFIAGYCDQHGKSSNRKKVRL